MKVFDLSDFDCPIPLLKTKKILLSLPQGQSIKILLGEQASQDDTILLCKQKNYSVTVDGFNLVISKN